MMLFIFLVLVLSLRCAPPCPRRLPSEQLELEPNTPLHLMPPPRRDAASVDMRRSRLFAAARIGGSYVAVT